MKIGAFVLPVIVWSIVSYFPFVWHPMILVSDPGGSTYRVGDRLPRQDFADLNAKLATSNSKLARGDRANPVFLPAPHEVAMSLYKGFTTPPFSKRDPWLHQSIWHSLGIIFWGFVASAIVGVPIGILCGTYDLFSKLVEPFVDFIRYMPAPAFGALMVAICGIDDGPKIAIIFIGTFFQMVLVVANTTRQVDVSLLEAAQTLGAKNGALIRKVIIPSILPDLYRDMRILIGWAWTYLIVAELIGAASGISYFINQQGKYRNYPNVYAGIIIIGLIGLITDQILGWLGPKLFPWTPEAAARRGKRARKKQVESAPPEEPKHTVADLPTIERQADATPA